MKFMKRIVIAALLFAAFLLPGLAAAGSVDLTWTAPGTPTSYAFAYGTVKGGPYPTRVTVAASASMVANLTGLPANAQICGVVIAIAGTLEAVPSPETCLTSTAEGTLGVQINPVQALTGYAISYGTTKGGPYPKRQVTGVVTSASVPNLPGGQNCFVVRVVVPGAESGPSNEACATVPFPQVSASPGAATNLNAIGRP